MRSFLLVHASQAPRVEVIESIRAAERQLTRSFAAKHQEGAEGEKQPANGSEGPQERRARSENRSRHSLLSLLSQEGQGLYGKNGISSAAWENWGTFGLLLYGLMWIGVAAVMALEVSGCTSTSCRCPLIHLSRRHGASVRPFPPVGFTRISGKVRCGEPTLACRRLIFATAAGSSSWHSAPSL